MRRHSKAVAVACAVATLGMGVTASVVWGASPAAQLAAVRPPTLPDFNRGPAAATGPLASQWKTLAKAYEQGGQAAAEDQGSDQKLIDAHGSYQSAKWEFALTLQKPTAAFTLGSPPGFEALTGGALQFGFPSGSGWKFKIGGGIKAHAKVKIGGTTVFSWSPHASYSLTLPRIHLLGGLTLDVSDPSRPTVKSRKFDAQGAIAFGGVLSHLHPQLQFGQVDGAPALIGGASGDLGLPDVGAHFDGKVSVSFLPTRAPDFEAGASAATAKAAKSVAAQLGLGEWVLVRLRLDGKVSFKLAHVARRDAHATMQFSWPLPSQREVNNFLLILAGFSNFSLPRRWGDNPPPAYRTPPPPPGVDYGAAARGLEANIGPHIPNGIVHSIDGPGTKNKYTVEGDAALATGEYLAAEAFRYSSTKDPQALERLKFVLGGVDRLFWVTEDAAGSGNEIKPNPYAPGTLSRTATPASLLAPIVVHLGAGRRPVTVLVPAKRRPGARSSDAAPTAINFSDGPLNKRGCYYVRPENGWTVTVGRKVRHVSSYAQALGGARSLLRGSASGKIAPSGRVWYGFACGDTRPISRDQYTGVFFGLGMAYKLVDDPGVRDHIRALVDKALGYLQRNSWRILVPFQGQGDKGDLAKAKTRNLGSENFLLNFDNQASFRRVGATVDPGRWLNDYEAVAPALAAPAWAGVYLSALDPLFQYYKFNLAHEVLGSLLFLENGDALHQAYLPAFDLLRGATRTHQNAYFDLLYILVQPDALRSDTASEPSASNPSISVADEVRSILADWIVRRDAVKGPSGFFPLLNVADPAFVAGLWPNSAIGIYTTMDFNAQCLSQWALPPRARPGPSRDNLWEQQPFAIAAKPSTCNSRSAPTASDIQKGSSSGPYPSVHEAPGVDYLLPYWMGVYLGVLPPPA